VKEYRRSKSVYRGGREKPKRLERSRQSGLGRQFFSSRPDLIWDRLFRSTSQSLRLPATEQSRLSPGCLVQSTRQARQPPPFPKPYTSSFPSISFIQPQEIGLARSQFFSKCLLFAVVQIACRTASILGEHCQCWLTYAPASSKPNRVTPSQNATCASSNSCFLSRFGRPMISRVRQGAKAPRILELGASFHCRTDRLEEWIDGHRIIGRPLLLA
jgi:hypothetical protein